MIAVEHVSKSFGTHVAVSDVSLELSPGRTTALIGPSGCGKSTLLRLLLGLIETDSGEVYFGGAALHPSRLREIRQRAGYAIQSGGLFPHLTARRNVELPARHAGWSREQTGARIAELASMVHLSESTLGRFPAELSGGQRQRVALMRALVLDPGVLLLDEPLGALDPLIRGELQREFRSLFRELRKTVVLVTHDLAEAAYLAPDDIVLLRSGKVVQRGTFAELRDDPTDDFVRHFVGAQLERVEALRGGGA